MRARNQLRGLAALFLTAALSLACNSDPKATEGSGTGPAAANAERVLVSTLAPVPTRTQEPATPIQPPAPTLFVPTSTQSPPTATATHTPTPSATATQTQTPSPTASPTVGPSPTPTATVTGASAFVPLSDRELWLLNAHNEERAARDVAPLRIDATLQKIARERAQIMADNHRFSHLNLNGDTIYDMLDDEDYPWDDATENIHFNDYGFGQADAVAMSEYMASPAHRANILKAGFHRVGVATATSSAGVHYYSIVFSD